MKWINSAGKDLTAFVLASNILAFDAVAQEGQASETKELEKVTVTGSHLSNPNIVSPSPISVLSADDIKATGAVNIGDLMTRLPQLGTSFTMGNSSRFIGTAGMQPMDLRNLGLDRTLTLVNGRRFVGSSAGSTMVDVNMIPVELIERVEIITGGASAVYGADAVTGVINFILKRDYQGANLNVQYGTTQHGGFDQSALSLTGGTSYADGRGHLMGSVEHSNQQAFDFTDRFGHQQYASVLTPAGPYDRQLYPNAGGYTMSTGGTFSLGKSTDITKRYIFNPGGSVRPQSFKGPWDTSGVCADCDFLNTNDVLQLQPRYARTTMSGIADYQITPEHRIYAEGTYSHSDVKKWTQPAFGSGSRAYTIQRDNAYIQPDLAALMDANNAKSIRVSRFDVDAGRRGEDIKRNLARLVLGSDGKLVGDWNYDASLNYGESRETRYNLNNRINDRFAASIDAVVDPASGQVVCRSSIDPAAKAALNPIAQRGCVPTSIFGAGAIDPKAAAWFNTTTTTQSKLTQLVGGGTVTNNHLFAMPFDAGDVSVAAGAEFRRESSRQDTDPLDQAGLTFLNAIPSSSGAYNVKEAYIEGAFPLITARPFVQGLTFDAAARFSDYSTVGYTKAWRWGLDWAVDNNVRFRGTMSSAVRAPNIGELFGGRDQNYFTVSDPCSAPNIKNAKNPAVRAANCAAAGIPPAWISTNTSSIAGISGSNPDLDPERGATWTAGLVLTPSIVPGFGMSLDYWNIKLTDAITAPSGTDVVNRCVDSPTYPNMYCGNMQRDPVTHEVIYINSIQQNIAAIKTSGVDLNANYRHAVGPGTLVMDLSVTRLLTYTSYPYQDDPTETIREVGIVSMPKWKSTLRTSYIYGNWLFNWNMRHFSSMLLVSNESYASNPMSRNPIRTPAGFYNDLKVSYSFGKSGWQTYAGVNNVFDKNPPDQMINSAGSNGLYDYLGRAFYAGFNLKW